MCRHAAEFAPSWKNLLKTLRRAVKGFAPRPCRGAPNIWVTRTGSSSFIQKKWISREASLPWKERWRAGVSKRKKDGVKKNPTQNLILFQSETAEALFSDTRTTNLSDTVRAAVENSQGLRGGVPLCASGADGVSRESRGVRGSHWWAAWTNTPTMLSGWEGPGVAVQEGWGRDWPLHPNLQQQNSFNGSCSGLFFHARLTSYLLKATRSAWRKLDGFFWFWSSVS